MQGWIKLHRRLLEWEWYDDVNVKVLFLHLLLTVNYEEKKWRGNTIKKGERITSLAKLAKETRLSVKQLRLALNKLEKTGEVARKGTNQYTHITLTKWEEYQLVEEKRASKETNKGQTKGKQRATTKEGKESKKVIETANAVSAPSREDADIIAIIEKFQVTELNPNISYGHTTNRSSARFLADKYGLEVVLKIIDLVASEQYIMDPFSPRITTPYMLKQKWGDIRQYIAKLKGKQNSRRTAIIE